MAHKKADQCAQPSRDASEIVSIANLEEGEHPRKPGKNTVMGVLLTRLILNYGCYVAAGRKGACVGAVRRAGCSALLEEDDDDDDDDDDDNNNNVESVQVVIERS